MKMKFISLWGLAMMLTTTTFAQEKTILESTQFSGVKAVSGTTIYLVQSDSSKVTVSPADFDADNIKLIVKDGVLKIESGGAGKNVKIIVYSPEFKSLEATGASNIKIEGNINGADLKIINNGASDISGEINFNKLTVQSTGASDLKLKGNADTMDINISGASDFKAFELKNIIAIVHASGASDVQINTDSALYGKISGASSIKFLKEPTINEIESSGGSTESTSPQTTWIEVEEEYSVEELGDTTKIRINDKEIVIIEKDGETKVLRREADSKKSSKKAKFKGNWVGLEFGVNGLLTPDFKLTMPAEYNYMELSYPKSTNFNLNFFQQSVPIFGRKFGLVTGMGLQWNNYRFSNNSTTLTTDSNEIGGYFNQTIGRTYEKSKLTAMYLTVPLLFEFQTNKNHESNSFHISAGVIGALKINAHTKQVYSFDGSGTNKPKTWDDFYIQPFKLDATMRIGWGPLNIYTTYGLTPLFREGKGPELYPFTFGLILPFS